MIAYSLPQRAFTLLLLLLAPLFGAAWLVSAFSAPISSNNLLLTGHSGASSQAIAYDNETVALANGPVLSILDSSNSSQPERLGFYTLDDSVTALAMHSDIIYVGTAGGGLQLIDATLPGEMSLLMTLHPGETIYDVEVAGKTLYATHDTGLTAYNISMPANPGAGSTVPAEGSWRQIHLAGNRGLATDDNGKVFTLDLTTPTQPITQAHYQINGIPGGLSSSGNVAYVGWSDCPAASCTAKFTVLDISNPFLPTFTTERTVGDGRALGVSVSSGYLYITRIGNSAAHTEAALDVYDIATPAIPSFAADYNSAGTYGAFDIILDSPTAYLAHDGAGLHLLDISDPTNPALNSSWSGPSQANALVFANGLAYVGSQAPSDRAEFWILDPATAQGPAPVNQLRINQLSTIDALAIDDEIAFLLGARPSGNGSRIRLVDVANPVAPISLVSFDTDTAYHIAAANGYAYLHDDNGTQIIDAREIMTVTQVASYGFGGHTFLIDSRAYIAAGNDGLHILSVSSPANPSLLGSLNGSWSAEAVAVIGSYAFLAAGADGIRVIDVSNPAAPQEVGSLLSTWQAETLAIQDDFLVVGTSAEGVRIIEISEPTMLTEVAHYRDGWTATAVATNGTTILAAAGADGLFQFEQFFAISGRIFDLNGVGVLDTPISLSGQGTAISEGDGDYMFSGIPAGSYTLTPSDPTFVFSPTMRQISLPPNGSGQDFLMIPAPISGVVTPAGSTLIFTDTQNLPTAVTIPAGAVSETVTLVITPTIVADQGQSLSLNHAFDLAVYIGGVVQPDYQFLNPLIVTIRYSDLDLQVAIEAGLTLQQWQAPIWQDAGFSCNPVTNGSVSSSINEFEQGVCETGRFALFGPVRQIFLPVVSRP